MSHQAISFHYTDQKFTFKNRNQVRDLIRQIIRKEKAQLKEIHYIFCSDSYLLRLNQTYLKHNTLTDIITFQYNTHNEPIVSDIYISIERVQDNARDFHVSFQDELLRVIFHGALHLVGYKDKTPKDQIKMREKENFYLHLYKSST